MRYHFNSKDNEPISSSSNSNWSTGNLESPNVLKTIDNPNGAEGGCYSDEQLNNLYSFDAYDPVSLSHKRKILDCERGDFEERFRKIQRKKQIQRAAAKAHLVVDDDEGESDEEDEIYEQMDWIEKENESIDMEDWESSDEDEYEDNSFASFASNVPVFLVHPRSKWKEERRRLLRISMAKIRRVEDPESYLRRSVLINNTVKRLQRDVTMNLVGHSFAAPASYIQGNSVHETDSNWGSTSANTVICKQQNHSDMLLGINYSSLTGNTVVQLHDSLVHSNMPNPVHFHLAFASSFSSDKTLDMSQQGNLNSTLLQKSPPEEQRLNEMSISPVILKQPSPLHLFSSQSCGLQYRSVVQDEDADDEYIESPNSSSILDSVVYHSLVASLET